MRRFIILAALAMVPASVASADPPDRGDRYGDRDYWDGHRYEGRWHDSDGYRDGYYDRGGRPVDNYREAHRRWRPIAEGTSAGNERQFINVWERGVYHRLLVEGVRGAPVIHKVAVEFGDRQTQVWDLNRRLPRGADQVIDLGGDKRIRRIIVYTEPSNRGAYSVYGG